MALLTLEKRKELFDYLMKHGDNTINEASLEKEIDAFIEWIVDVLDEEATDEMIAKLFDEYFDDLKEMAEATMEEGVDENYMVIFALELVANGYCDTLAQAINTLTDGSWYYDKGKYIEEVIAQYLKENYENDVISNVADWIAPFVNIDWEGLAEQYGIDEEYIQHGEHCFLLFDWA